MRKIVNVLFVLLSVQGIHAQTNVFECDAYYDVATQADLNAVDTYLGGCVFMEDPNGINFTGASNKEVLAASRIHVDEGFHAGGFTALGGIHLGIHNVSPFEVVAINYSDLSAVRRYKKFELGIALPNDILTRVNHYLFQEGQFSDELNPFVEWDLDVEAIFHNSSPGWYEEVDGFYYREYVDQLGQIGDTTWTDTTTHYPIRIRYAPPRNGNWTCQVRIKVNDIVLYTSPSFGFRVVESWDPGYVYVHSNNKNLMRGNRMIFPVGQNFISPEKGVWGYHNLNPYTLEQAEYGEELQPNETHIAASPLAWGWYLDKVENYFKAGGKYIRTIQDPKSSLIEFEKKGNYYDRLHYAWGQDKLLDLCEEYDALITMNLLLQCVFMKFGDYYLYDWDWDSYNMDGIHNPNSPYPIYCYNDNPGVKMPHEMFINEDDLKYHEQRIRYYVARYGYSTKLYEFELLSEPYHLNQLWQGSGSQYEPYLSGNSSEKSQMFNAIEIYQKRMAKYIKEDLGHWQQLVGVNAVFPAWLTGGVFEHDKSYEDANIDIVGLNWYQSLQSKYLLNDYHHDPDGNNVFFNDENTFAKAVHDFWTRSGKPIVLSEGDHGDVIYDCSGTTSITIDAMSMGFTGLCGFHFWAGKDENQANIWPVTIRAQNHMNGDDVIGTLSRGYGGWIQGRQNQSLNNESLESKEQQYYVSADKERCVGYVKNLSYNVYTMRTNNDCILPGIQPPVNNLYSFNWNDGSITRRLKIDGLKNNTDYRVDFYSLNDPKYGYGKYVSSYCESSSVNGKLTLKFPHLDPWNYNSGPILWYVIKQQNCQSRLDVFDENEQSGQTQRLLNLTEEEGGNVSIYPNPFADELTIVVQESTDAGVYTMDGQLIMRVELKAGENNINTKSLAKGIYLIQLENLNIKYKLVKQ